MWTSRQVTCVAPINIAFIKYWGKRDEEQVIPTNDSYSITLSTDVFCTKTTVMASKDFTQDELWLNKQKVDVASSKRLQNVLKSIRTRSKLPQAQFKIRAVSENNFPTAAGMASSASGYCCLVYALAKLFEISGDITTIARVGSGSSCRSLYGGFVKWLKGSDNIKLAIEDSVAVQGVPASKWPDFEILILVSKTTEKDVSSTEGMKQTLITCPFIQERINVRVPQRMDKVHDAILKNDFSTFAQITMDDSDDLRAVCVATKPPIDYWTPKSHAVIKFVKAYNQACSVEDAVTHRCCYTFDAGPNAFVFTRTGDLAKVLKAILFCFPTPSENFRFQHPFLAQTVKETKLPTDVEAALKPIQMADGFNYIFHTRIGNGLSEVQDPDGTKSLMTSEGKPKFAA